MNDYPFENEPWDRDSFETGSTKPPKSRSGLIAALLVAVIILGGVSSILSVMNIRLFRQLEGHDSQSASVSFNENTLSTGEISGSQSGTVATSPGGNVQVDIQQTPEGVDNVPQAGGLSYQQIYAKAIPSVVSITCQLSGGSSTGTGVILSENGYIVTNCHVVNGAQSISVLLTDNRTFSAFVVGMDSVSDLAVLYVQATDLTPAEFGNSDSLKVGDAVAAIGDPLGAEFRGTMTDGIVSAINRDVVTGGRTMTLIQTNAALNSGNSGGPLLNCYGQVIGINTLKISAFVDDAGVEGLGFAIPSTTVKSVVDQLIAQGYVSGRPSLGISGETVSVLEQKLYRLPAGVLVSQVEEGSCADQAGIIQGDVIISAGGARVESAEALSTLLYQLDPGNSLDLGIYRYRSGKQLSVTVILDEATGE